jgi:cytochrome c551/c552
MSNGIKEAGGISFGVSMNTGKLQKNIAQGRKMLGGFVNGTKNMMGQWQSQLAGMVATGSLIALAKQSFYAIDALHDTAKNLNVTTEALSRLGHAADQNGGSQSSLESALTRVSRSTTAALDPATKLGALYSKLGLNAQELMGMSPDKQFMAIAEAVKGLGNEQEQLVTTQQIFGKSAGDLIETLRLGKDGLNAMADASDRLGNTINGLDAEKVAAAADEMDRAGKVMKGIMNDAAIDFGPKVTGLMADVATGISYATGGQGGETRAERDLRTGMETKAANQKNLEALEASRWRQKQMTPGTPQNKAWLAENAKKSAARKVGQAKLGENTVDLMKSFAPAITDFAKDFGTNAKQLAQDALANPITSATGKTWGGAIMQADLKGAKAKQPKSITNSIRDFSAEQSGSLAAYQQRIRGAQQFDKASTKIPEKQLDVQEESRDYLKDMAGFFKGFTAEGAVS